MRFRDQRGAGREAQRVGYWGVDRSTATEHQTVLCIARDGFYVSQIGGLWARGRQVAVDSRFAV